MSVSPPAPGTPFHRLARTERHRWWLPLVATAAVLASVAAFGGVLLGLGRAAGLLAGSGRVGAGAIADTALLLLVIGLALPVVLMAARAWQHRPAGTLSSVQGRVRWRWLGTCSIVALPCVWLTLQGGAELLDLTGGGRRVQPEQAWVGWPTFAISLAMLLALVPLQAAAEEYAFRGWLLQAVGSFGAPAWLAIWPQALLFAAAHGWGTPWGFADLLVMGLLGGWLAVRTGGLEAAVALHAVNNLVAFGGVAALGLLDPGGTAADAPWQRSAVNLVIMLGYTAVVLRLAARRAIMAVVPPPATPAPPAGWRHLWAAATGRMAAWTHRTCCSPRPGSPSSGPR
jgi:membrane protease YdiL (CAAX protease family)